MSSRMSISVLANEILLEIFFMNTNIFLENDCLRTTICCSQVSRSWRSLLLFTPSVWGRLLHVNELRPRNSSTRERILSRSRNSLLWVSGTIYSRQLHGEAQLLRFLLNSILYPNWDRIEHLNLSIHSASEEDLWPIIQLPAPNLRSFHFSGKADHERHVVFTTDAQPLFSDCAPMLQRFSADCIPFTLSAPWMRHLRQITVGPQFTIRQILVCLQSMPLLEDLILLDIPLEESHPHVPLLFTFLPHLSKISLQNIDMHDCILFLDQIHPADGCAINFKPKMSYPVEHLKLGLESILPTLSARLAQYFSIYSSNVQDVEIHLSSARFRFECFPQRLHDTGKFKVAITPSSRFPIPADLHTLMLPLFSGCDFSGITTLKFNSPPLLVPSYDTMETYLPYFVLFPSITNLSVSEKTLQWILLISAFTSPEMPLYPLLQTLTITAFEDKTANSARPLIQFLHHRRDIGFPVQKLVYYASSYQPNLLGLEEMTGLRVCRGGLNGEVEYVC